MKKNCLALRACLLALAITGIGSSLSARPMHALTDNDIRYIHNRDGIPLEGSATVYISQRVRKMYFRVQNPDGTFSVTEDKIVVPTNNYTYRIKSQSWHKFDPDALPLARDDNDDGRCDLNSAGFCMIEKISHADPEGKIIIPEQISNLEPWGNSALSVYAPAFFVPIDDNRPLRRDQFVPAIHSEIANCGKSKLTAYYQSDVDYFGENPFQGTVPGCAPPPAEITARDASHGCIRADRVTLWKLLTYLIQNHEIDNRLLLYVLD